MSDAPRPLFLVGFMGVGKSRVGRELATRAGRPFVDLDACVERAAGRPVRAIFAAEGEAGFRARERRELVALDLAGGPVVACGGGLFASREARRWIAERGTSVWLDAPLDVVRVRVEAGPDDGAGGRPLWPRAEPLALRALYERRRAAYALATLRVGSAGREAGDVAAEVLRRVEAAKP